MADLSVFSSSNKGEGEGMLKLVTKEEENNDWTETSVCCFAGRNDEFVVATSDEDLHMWSVPEGLNSDEIDRHMLLPYTHGSRDFWSLFQPTT